MAVEIEGIGTADYNSVGTVEISNIVTPTASSGGSVLGSGAVTTVVIKNLSGNADIWIGSSGIGKQPYSGYGFSLADQEAITIEINQLNSLYVCANVSGEAVSFVGR